MRTTITLDDHLARELKSLAHSTGKPFKQVVNETLQEGLARRGLRGRKRRYRLTPLSLGGVLPGIDLDKALRLAGDLEDDAIARELELRK